MKLPNRASAWCVTAFVGLVACETQTVVFDAPPATPSFEVATDAGAAEDAEAGLIAYCPSSACPPGFTTCPDSRFPCDTNVSVDSMNCGACGVACPQRAGGSSYVCVEGACTMKCTEPALDCDGIPDNGCEASAYAASSCGGCGIVCDDPSKPCVRVEGKTYQCGCPDGQIWCGGRCVDVMNDDAHCSACGVVCDPSGGGQPPRPNAVYGCIGGQCNQLKCTGRFADCDGNEENGCETPLTTAANCGGCGLACASGQECRLTGANNVPTCTCAPGETQCGAPCPEGSTCSSSCADLLTNGHNCGGCGISCATNSPHTFGSCSHGACVYRCDEGWADCNDSSADGCETKTSNDPRNCGGCGISCDLLLGQACVAGRCVVEPCADLERDAGEIAR